MICIQIAGAGAGKTYGLAKKIKSKWEDLPKDDGRKIYALTYTNSARDKIKSELTNHFKILPDNIYIDTVHSFLINEVIFPFSKYVLGVPYNKVSLESLPSEVKFKKARIKKLQSDGIVHVDSVYKLSKQILDRKNAKHSNKYKRSKVDYVNSLILNFASAIFIDEVQDLDEDCLRVFQILGESDIYVYMIGDPKQAIKYPGHFSMLKDQYSADIDGKVRLEPFNNATRRVPESVLRISNKFCFSGQEQHNINEFEGMTRFIYNDVVDFESVIEKVNFSGNMVIIDKKNEIYSTNKTEANYMPFKLEGIIADGPMRDGRDPQLYIKSVYFDLLDELNLNDYKTSVNSVVRKHNLGGILGYYKEGFAIFYEFAKSHAGVDKQNKIIAKSIESVKGLESKVVFFVLSNSFINYLCGIEIGKEKKHNKEWNKIYVALTRTKDKLVFVLDKRLLSSDNLRLVESFFDENNIFIINDVEECISWL
ncbi:UvrD-helicase domain-containing protein [Serratia marcescens]|uniref:UvrD-helicase domain-containing protein n=1 Tax=Serratia marcescens TaxID=615 RepID=UPI0029EFC170|nr:AAA family ATPase [Serratia marcescens]